MSSDAELVAESLAGDAAAYTRLMRRHFDAVFAAARSLTSVVEDAEDACQEAFARAFFRLNECGQPTQFRGWILQIARYQALNIRRYQALRAGVRSILPEERTDG